MKKILLILAGLLAILIGAGAAESVGRRDSDGGKPGSVPGFSSGKNKR